MKKLFLSFLVFTNLLLASVTNEQPSLKLLNSHIPIVDIRTPGEWKESGLLKGAIPIMFFNQRGGYDLNAFLKELNAKVDTKKPFALICHSGNRTTTVSKYLSQAYGYKIINLVGGMISVQSQGLPVVPYKK